MTDKPHLECDIVNDLLPLYIDGLVSQTTQQKIQAHLAECPACAEQLQATASNPVVDLPASLTLDLQLDDDKGRSILKRIRQTQNRVKYTFIIFSVFTAVGITLLSGDIFTLFPFIIIVPLILRLFYRETKVILLSVAAATFLLLLTTGDIEYVIFNLITRLPVTLCCSGAGVFAAASIRHIWFEEKEEA